MMISMRKKFYSLILSLLMIAPELCQIITYIVRITAPQTSRKYTIRSYREFARTMEFFKIPRIMSAATRLVISMKILLVI